MDNSPLLGHGSSYCVMCGGILAKIKGAEDTYEEQDGWPVILRSCTKCGKVYNFSFKGVGPDVTMSFRLELYDEHFFQMIARHCYKKATDYGKKYRCLFKFRRFDHMDAGTYILDNVSLSTAKEIKKALNKICLETHHVSVYKCTDI